MAPKAVAPSPSRTSCHGRTAVAISCPTSERRLVSPNAATVRLNQPRPFPARSLTRSILVDETHDHARAELRLEPGALRGHHLPRVRDAHDVGQAGRVQSEGDDVLPG